MKTSKILLLVWRLAEGKIPPGDSDEKSGLLEHVRLVVWTALPSGG